MAHHLNVWGTPPTDADETGEAVVNLLRTLTDTPPPQPTSLDYERYVEQPRRHGRDPVWESLMAEALADNPQPTHKTGAA